MSDIWDRKPPAYKCMGTMVYSQLEMEDWLIELRAEMDLLREHSGRWLHFVAVDFPSIRESLTPEKLMELREKTQKCDDLPRSVRRLFDESTPEQFIQYYKDIDKAINKLEAVKNVMVEWGEMREEGIEGDYFHKDYFFRILKILEVEE